MRTIASWVRGCSFVGVISLALIAAAINAPASGSRTTVDWSTVRSGAASVSLPRVAPSMASLVFEPVEHKRATFQAKSPDYAASIASDGVALTLPHHATSTDPKSRRDAPVQLHLVGTSARASTNDATKAKYTNVYPGIDLAYRGENMQLAYDFVVAPHADPKPIHWNVQGAKQAWANAAGELEMVTTHGVLIQGKPTAYQFIDGKQHMVPVEYLVRGQRAALRLGHYDSTQSLTVSTGALSVVRPPSNQIASATPIAYPDASACLSDTPSYNLNGSQPGMPGVWGNPKRYGTGWQMSFAAQGAILTWWTYDALRRPVFLGSNGTVTSTSTDSSGAKSFLMPLYKSTLASDGTRNPLIPVGQVAVTFKAGSQVSAAVSWQWDDVGPNAQPAECVYDYFHAPSGSGVGGAATVIDESYSGAWYDQSQSGWGVFFADGTRPNGNTIETATAAIYDTAGNPVWVQGVNGNGTPVTSTQTYSLDYTQSTASGYPNGFPTTDCSNSSCITHVTVASMTRSFVSSQKGTVQALTASVDASVTGADPVNWPGAINISYPASIYKLTDTTTILVNQNPCPILSGSNSCPLVVSWASEDPTALLYIWQASIPSFRQLLSSSNSGSTTINLSQGSDIYFELAYHDSTGQPVSFYSAEVTTSGTASGPSTPYPPFHVSATAATDGSGHVTVTWDPDTLTTPAYYQLASAPTASGPWTMLASGLPLSPSQTTTTMTTSGAYFFGIAACDNTGACSNYVSSELTSVTVTPPPSQPTCTASSVNAAVPVIPVTGINAQTVTVGGVQNTTSTVFITKSLDNPSDAQPISGTDGGNGNWSASISLSLFDPSSPRYGQFQTDVYLVNNAYNGGAQVYCGNVQWTRTAPTTVPGAPSPVTATESATTPGALTVNWTATTGTAAYFVFAQQDPSTGSWTPIGGHIQSTSTTTTVSVNGTYYFGIAACDASDNCSAYTGVTVSVSDIPAGIVPPSCSASSTITAIASGANAETITVTGVQNETSIVFSTSFGGNPQGSPLTVPNTADTISASIDLTGNPNYGQFSTAVSVVNGAYNGGAPVSCGLPVTWTRTQAGPTAPGVPSINITLPQPGSGAIGLNWSPESSTAGSVTGYVLEQSTSSGGPWAVPSGLNNPLSSTTNVEQITVTTIGTYYFRLAACNGSACSGYATSSAQVTPPSAPALGSVSAVATPGSGVVSVNWGGSADATSYQIQYTGPASNTITVNGTGTTASVNLTSSGTYSFGVAACNFLGCSSFTPASSTVSMVLPTTVVLPTLPPIATPVNDLPAHDATVGTMSGQAGTDGGAAQYQVPIVIPPGRAGMQPDLALVYSSRSGNGVMGVGWSISGVSSIHRCPQTPEQDGQTLGVSYSSTDRLCLDGQRLVAVSGNYGESGTVYRTEVDSYARITQTGGSLATKGSTVGSACFRVEQKNGRILHYGAVTTGSSSSVTGCATSTANARVTPGGAPGALSWLIEKIEDRVGNNELFQYTDYTNGEVLLKIVTYTGFGTTAGDRTVTFAYGSRTTAATGATDISSSYLAGGLTMQTQALTSVTTAASGSTVRTYTPGYTVSSYTGRLMLTSLQECAGGTCHPATQFSYNDSTPSYAFKPYVFNTPNFGMPAGLAAHDARPIGDLDGDGSREVAIPALSSNDGSMHLFLTQITADNKQHGLVDLTGTPFTYATDGTADYVDLDGDGRAKLLVRPPLPAGATTEVQGTLKLAQWKKTDVRGESTRGEAVEKLVQPGATPQQNFDALFDLIPTNITMWSGDKIYAADMNGDGKPDLIILSPNAGCPVKGSTVVSVGVSIYLNQMTGPLTSGQTANFKAPSGPLFCLDQTNATQSTGTTSFTQLTVDHIADFDGDGIPDFFIGYTYETFNGHGGYTQLDSIRLVKPQADGSFQITSKNCGATGLALCKYTLGNSNTISSVHHWMDVNGDGLEDFVYATPGGTWQVQLNQGGKFGAAIDTQSYAGLDTSANATSFRYATKAPMLDVDGDGKPDLLTPSTLNPNPFVLRQCTLQLTGFLQNDPGACPEGFTAGNAPVKGATSIQMLSCPVYACPEIPGTNNVNLPLNAATDRGGYKYTWLDEPADGLYGKFQGGPSDFSSYHMDMLKFIQTGAASFSAVQSQTAMVSQLSNTTQQNAAVNGSFFYWSTDTSSVSALNFVTATAPASKDIGGRGLDSLSTLLGCPVGATQITLSQGSGVYYMNSCEVLGDGTYGPAILPDGITPTSNFEPKQPSSSNQFNMTSVLYSNDNQGVVGAGTTAQSTANSVMGANCAAGPVLPGLMNTATNGLGDTAQWGYDTLATGLLCSRDGVAEYTIKNQDGTDSGYTDKRHYYFASSMPVVSAMLQSDGMGGNSGSRSAIYGYSEAMYNHYGRGFQGFRTITAENLTRDSARRLITQTTFNQKFPVVGKIASAVTRVPPSNGSGASPAVSVSYDCTLPDGTVGTCKASNPVHIETSTYQCGGVACSQGNSLSTPTGGTVYQPLPSVQSSTEYDLSSSTASSHASTSNVWDAYGNLTSQTVTRGDDSASTVFVSSHTTTTTNTFDTATTNVSNWWLNKLTDSTVTSSIIYDSGHALPSGASAPSQTLAASYTWNDDRTPKTKTVRPGVKDQQSTTTYTYPVTPATSYGLPLKVEVNAPDLSAALSPTRSTSYTYTKDGSTVAADGYFVYQTTNVLGATTTEHQASDGQVTVSTDPNKIKVTTTYDVFGRATQVSHQDRNGGDIELPIYSAYTACSSGSCAGGVGEDSREGNVAYRVTTTQAGYPTKVVWADMLGRPLKHAEAGFSGTNAALNYDFIATLVHYDSEGTTLEQSAPYFVSSGNPIYTGFTYDALNRVTGKVAPASCSGGAMTTSYKYSGRQTKVVASGTCGGAASNSAITMYRSNNSLGQLMQTLDANNKPTNYWTEPQGHVVAITDAESNLITASYNELGQRTASSDPDQGNWSFGYDALGELFTQTDARGVITKITGRDTLGRPLSQQAVPPANAGTGLAGEAIVDTWTYDPTNAIGQVDTQSRYRGSNITSPASNLQVWQQKTSYDIAARAQTVTTKINEGSAVSFSSTMTYDGYGRANTHTYPNAAGVASGLSVQHTYTAYGQLDALSNATTGEVYWTAQAENQWKHLTQEAYQGVIVGSHSDWDGTGQTQALNWTGSSVDQFAYTYDSFGNVKKQSRSTGGTNVSESYTYDNLQRLKSGTRVPSDAGHPAVSYNYSDSGNITLKSDWASSYTYGTNGCGPHFATGAGSASYSCDANGNLTGGNTLTAVYDVENRARSITRNAVGNLTQAGTMGWAYTSTGQIDVETSSQGTRYFGPDGYEQVGAGATASQVHEIGPVIVTRTNDGLGHSSDTVSVVLRDRLGSTMDVIEKGVPTTRAYDAFGKARNGDFSDRQNGTLNLTDLFLGGLQTIHGFTKHDHADDVALIHMGGRVYDYNLGRFLQVDPIISNPANSQSLNPYSYIGNNPLSGTDPTGYAVAPACATNHTCMSMANQIDGFKTGYSFTETMAAMKSGKVGMGVAGPGGAKPGQPNTEAQLDSSNVQSCKLSDAQPQSTASAATPTPHELAMGDAYNKLKSGNIGGFAATHILDSLWTTIGAVAGKATSSGYNFWTGENFSGPDQGVKLFMDVAALLPFLKGEQIAATEVKSGIGAFKDAAKGIENLLTVRTYTSAVGREGITSSGALRADTWVTLPSEIPSRAGHLQIEKILEIQPGRGSHFLDFLVPSSNLRIPANGSRTSGGALQFQLNEPVPIDPSTFRRPPGRPGG